MKTVTHAQRMTNCASVDSSTNARFDYDEAFCRNIGILSPSEQNRLRQTRVALAGVGGLGGLYAHGLARLGVGRFRIADGDHFEVANFNRQIGGNVTTVGRNKARSIAEQIRQINPEAEIEVIEAHLNPSDFPAFLEGADLVMNGIDLFSVQAHRSLMTTARAAGVPMIFGAPLGFSAAVLVFDPTGMDADTYFDWHDGQDLFEQLVHFVLGLAPAGLHLKDVDLRRVDIDSGRGPSHMGACLLAAGVVLTEATRHLLDRPGGQCVPAYTQFDAWRGRLRKGRLPRGNRGWLQRLKKHVLIRRWRRIQDLRSRECPVTAAPRTGCVSLSPNASRPKAHALCRSTVASENEAM